ncbi:hypothetical protein [Nocardia grenadensis]|uniref:hypothetical protein n=1 Tax=Nocardia grenadensis TaxID=931537 RepID=UPI003D93B1AF
MGSKSIAGCSEAGEPPVWVNWETYYEAAKQCHTLAGELRVADKPVHDALKGDCAGMAGDAPGCKQWGEAYDAHALATLQTCTNLADALENFGYVLYAVGYNHWYPDKSKPPRPPVGEVMIHSVQVPTSVADNGDGLRHDGGVEEFFGQLSSTIAAQFGKLPNGEIDKLATAGTVWSTFAGHEAVTGAASRIAGIADMLAGMDEQRTAQLISDHFGTLKSAAEQLSSTTQLMAAPVANYRTATVDVSNEITGEVNTLLIQIGVIAAAAVAASWLSFGGSLAAGTAGIAGTVTATVNTIRGLYQASRLYRLLGVTAVAATAVGVVKEFDALPDLNPISAALAGIIALRVNLDDDANPSEGRDDGSTSVAKTTEEKSQAVKDVVTDESGTLIGTEDATGVQMVSQKEVDAARTELTEKLGPPQVKSTPKGNIEVWEVSGDPKSTVTYRPFSKSGGPTLDFNDVPGVPIKRWHIPGQ